MIYCFDTVHVTFMDILLVGFGKDIIGTPEISIFFSWIFSTQLFSH